jgi:hypothetical protein
MVLLALAAGCSGAASSAPAATPAPSSASPATSTSPPAAQTPAASASGTAGAAPGWPMYHGDAGHSGLSPSMPDVNGALKVIASIKLDGASTEFGDCANYKGRVIGVRLDGTGAPAVFQPSASRQGGIWNPAGPGVDAAGDLYVVSANGSTFPGAAYEHTNSVLEVSSSGKLLSSFAPTDWAQNNEGDIGLGSQGVALVGTKWAVLGGKSGPVYVLRQGHLGGIGGQVSATNVCLSYGGPAVDGDIVYLPCTDGVRAVRVSSAGTLHVLWHAPDSVAGQAMEQVSVGATSRFATPAIYGSLVLVPTITGVVFVRAS